MWRFFDFRQFFKVFWILHTLSWILHKAIIFNSFCGISTIIIRYGSMPNNCYEDSSYIRKFFNVFWILQNQTAVHDLVAVYQRTMFKLKIYWQCRITLSSIVLLSVLQFFSKLPFGLLYLWPNNLNESLGFQVFLSSRTDFCSIRYVLIWKKENIDRYMFLFQTLSTWLFLGWLMCDGALGESPELIVSVSAILIKTTVDFRNPLNFSLCMIFATWFIC